MLEGRPIVGSTRVVSHAQVRAHALVAAGGAASRRCVVVLVAAPASSRSKPANAQRAAERALREAETTAAVKDFLLGLFAGADPRANAGKQVSVRDLLDKGAEHIDKDLGAQPALQAELKGTLGGIYSRLGLYPQAIALQEQAIAGLDAAGGQAKLAALTALDLATTGRANGDGARAQDTARRYASRASSAAVDAPGDKLIRALYLRTFVSISAHRFDEALADAERAESIARAHPEHPDLLGRCAAGESVRAMGPA